MGSTVARIHARTLIGILLAAVPVLVGDPLSSATGAAALSSDKVFKQPTPAPRLTVATRPIPEPSFIVLCYHQFGEQPPDDPEDKKKKRTLYKISREEFEWQMQYLKDNGITPLTYERVRSFLKDGLPIPARAVLITFDDGYRSIYTDAYPVLRRFGYPAVLFLYTDFIAAQGASLRFDEVREMLKHGFELGSHSKRHLNLARESVRKSRRAFRQLAIRELHESAEFLREKFGGRPRTFAYPYGVYTPAVIDEARHLGYETAFTINPGPNDRTVFPYKLRRHLVTYFTRRDLFAKIFEPKVLHLGHLKPPDGGVAWSRKPLISAQLVDDVDPKSIQLQVGQRILPHDFGKKTRTLTQKLLFPLKRGGHQATLTARDKAGIPRIYSWYFRVEEMEGESEEASDSLIPSDPGQAVPDAKEKGKKDKKKEKEKKKDKQKEKKEKKNKGKDS